MINKDKASFLITKDLVREANPEFFSERMMAFIGHTDNDWMVTEFRGQPCILIERPKAAAVACYFVNPITYKLAFWCHIADKLTRI